MGEAVAELSGGHADATSLGRVLPTVTTTGQWSALLEAVADQLARFYRGPVETLAPGQRTAALLRAAARDARS